MKMGRKYLTLVFTCLVLLTASGSSKGLNYDGQWWLSINERQRLGFVDGFAVCYSYLVAHQVFSEDSLTYAKRLTGYLEVHSESLTGPVEITLIKIVRPPYARRVDRPPTSNETPEELAAKWGANNDGGEWRGPDAWNLGYVQGFLECYSRHTKSEYGTFSRSPEWYVDAISKWYGTEPGDPDKLDESRAGEKIPEVLFRFRDGNDADKSK